MGAGEWEYRVRYWTHALIFTLGFVAPWDWLAPKQGPRTSAWLDLAGWLARQGWMSFSASTVALLVLGIAAATAGAVLRTWGGAYIGGDIVQSGAMHGDVMVADGPYRWVRNPLYLGTWLHTLALSLLMPVSGALFAIVAIAIVQMRLILREEPFLRGKLGMTYEAYCARVPRIVPALMPRIASARVRPHWVPSILAEVYFWGVAIAFAALGWRYNASLLTQGVVVSLGAQLIARGFAGGKAITR